MRRVFAFVTLLLAFAVMGSVADDVDVKIKGSKIRVNGDEYSNVDDANVALSQARLDALNQKMKTDPKLATEDLKSKVSVNSPFREGAFSSGIKMNINGVDVNSKDDADNALRMGVLNAFHDKLKKDAAAKKARQQ